MKYSAYAECEIISFGNCEISPAVYGSGRCEIKFVPSHAAGVFHCRRQFHTRQRISLVPQERISLKKAIRLREWLFSWQGQEDSNPRPTVLETGTLPAELYPCATGYIISHFLEKSKGFCKKNQIFFEKIYGVWGLGTCKPGRDMV